MLASPEYGRLFARQWADLLVKRDFDSNKRLDTGPFTNWLAGKLNAGAGWDAIVREILTASGLESDTPQALFYLANQDNMQPSPAKLVGATGNLFMGVQVQCAECHVHPDRGQVVAKGLLGHGRFLRPRRRRPREERKRPADARHGHDSRGREESRPAAASREEDRRQGSQTRRDDRHPRPDRQQENGRHGQGEVLRGPDADAAAGHRIGRPSPTGSSRRKNKYFATNAVNRLWAHLFARGLVNPVEDTHDGQPTVAPGCVERPCRRASCKHGYDQQFILRAICNTRAYQRTSRPLPENAEAEDKLFAQMP